MPGQRFSEEQIAQANRVNLLDLARRLGYEPVQVSNLAWKIPNQGGLYIHADGSRWHCFTREVGGGPIQFAMHAQHVTWLDALRQLVGQPDQTMPTPSPNPNKKQPEEREPFLLPPKGDTLKHVLAYLIGYRKLDKDIVYDMVKQGLLYENDKHSCVFVGKDEEGVARFASVRSTNTLSKRFRADVQNSDKAYSFSVKGTNDQLHVFESPIDLMSYLTLVKREGITGFQSHMLSLSGVSSRPLTRYLKEHPEISQVTLCLDNDEAGHTAAREIANGIRGKVRVADHFPIEKDWNDDLVAVVEEKERQRHVKIQDTRDYEDEGYSR